MTEAVHELLEKSTQSIRAAGLLLKEGYFSFAASRAYYAMFYAVEALLMSRGTSFSKHAGVIASFGKQFVKTGAFDSRFHRYLLNAFKLRNVGDYGGVQAVSEENARQVIDEAGELLSEIEQYLGLNDPRQF
ncbi:MAG: HEPN domain-containing protein [Syntrophobacteraceae bacterium]